MANKGILNKDIITAGKFAVLVDGVVLDKVLAVGDREQTIGKVELPDKTVVSNGRPEPFEFTLTIPEHEAIEFAFMEVWWNSCKDPIPVTAYKTVTLQKTSNSGNIVRTSVYVGAWITGRVSQELSIEDGTEEMTVIEYTLSVDDGFDS